MLSYEAFNFIKYIYIFFIIILVAMFILTSTLRKYAKFINWFTVVSISVICLVVSVLLLIFIGFAADEMNFHDVQLNNIFIAIIIFSIMNLIISYKLYNRNKQSI